jgi:hypothetical protein
MNAIKNYISDHLEIPTEIRTAISEAKSNLWHGIGAFQGPCQKIEQWLEDVDIPSYLDEEGYPLSFDDAHEKMASGELVWEFDTSKLNRELLGNLAPYINA